MFWLESQDSLNAVDEDLGAWGLYGNWVTREAWKRKSAIEDFNKLNDCTQVESHLMFLNCRKCFKTNVDFKSLQYKKD